MYHIVFFFIAGWVYVNAGNEAWVQCFPSSSKDASVYEQFIPITSTEITTELMRKAYVIRPLEEWIHMTASLKLLPRM